MRIWSLHPSILDQIGLVSCWRETLLAQAVLTGNTKGYKNHSQLQRFKASNDPIGLIATYLHGLCDEAYHRGYSFNRSKIISQNLVSDTIPVTTGQLTFEYRHLVAKQDTRKKPDLSLAQLYEPDIFVPCHPIFSRIDGDIEKWEKLK